MISPSGSSCSPSNGLAFDIQACHDALLAVLASICDPHLNTIHAVCQKFSESRGHSSSGPSLNPPRPVNRLLTTASAIGGVHTGDALYEFFSDRSHSTSSNPTRPDVDGSALFQDFFDSLLPDTSYVPPLGTAGPLRIPYLEPAHPIGGIELDVEAVWYRVLSTVDLSKADAEALASALALKVRCYGFGPVLMETDVIETCQSELQ